MRIAYLLGVFPPIAATPVLNQITGLLARGHEVDVFADASPGDQDFHPDVDRLGLLQRTFYTPARPRRLGGRLAGAARLYRRANPTARRILRRALDPLRFSSHATTLRLFYQAVPFLGRREYDIIQCGHGHDGRKALRLLQVGAVRGRLVTAFRGRDLTQYVQGRGSGVYRGLFRKGDLFQPVCEYFAGRLRAIGCPPNRIRTHPTGIDLGTFAPVPPSPRGGTLRLVSIARLVEKKGLGDALGALARLRAGGLAVEYTIAGEGPERARLEQRVRQFGLEGAVRLAGRCPEREIRRLLQWAHLLLAPSVTAANGDAEGIPNVLKEALAMHRPVVATPTGGIPELVEDGVTGLLVPERDPEALAGAVRRIADSPELGARLASAGRNRVLRDYDIEKLNDRLVETYRELL